MPLNPQICSLLRKTHQGLKTLSTKQKTGHVADNIFNCIFFHQNIWSLIQILLRLVPKDLINNMLPLIQVMAWCPIGAMPLPETMTQFIDRHTSHPA